MVYVFMFYVFVADVFMAYVSIMLIGIMKPISIGICQGTRLIWLFSVVI